ncbi:UNVERIFIED_CONTAM: Membrane-anchored ubiquitin-fold protein 3 [Sesamum calycinum]|uniref:Membrane-anchored ubiquitin-fold protein 3 n=1 Tax=Sesamum calycinum TaxID=2727403 RepID=A0AAW2SEU6_9LAMI
MAEGDEHLELKFRIFDGTDIGHGTYSSSITVATLKQRLLTEWPQDKSVVPKSVGDMKLIHAGKVLENGKTLAESRVHIGDLPGGVITMHVVVQPAVAKKKTEHCSNYDEASLREEMKCFYSGVERFLSVEIDMTCAFPLHYLHENNAKVVQNALNKHPGHSPKPTSPLITRFFAKATKSAGNMEIVENTFGFGCGLVNKMMSGYNQIPGVMGLGWAPNSFVNQITHQLPSP